MKKINACLGAIYENSDLDMFPKKLWRILDFVGVKFLRIFLRW